MSGPGFVCYRSVHMCHCCFLCLLYRTTDGKSLVDGQALALTQKHIFMKHFTNPCNNSHIHYYNFGLIWVKGRLVLEQVLPLVAITPAFL